MATSVYSCGRARFGVLGVRGESAPRAHTLYRIRSLDKEQIQRVYSGHFHSFAVSASGDIFAFGANLGGQLGVGDIGNIEVPARVTSFPDGRALAGGRAFSLGVDYKARLCSWGRSLYGSLGHGSNADQMHPLAIPTFAKMRIVLIACGETHAAAVSESGQLYMWGRADNFRIGVDSDEPGASVSCGHYHTVVATANGAVFTFGNGQKGQLGTGTTPYEGPPRVACGAWHTMAMTETGDVWAWGYGSYGQLGSGFRKDETSPFMVDLHGEHAVDISCGAAHSVVLTKSGTVFTCGSNRYGQLGRRTENDVSPTAEPMSIPGTVRVVSVALGSWHTLLVAENDESSPVTEDSWRLRDEQPSAEPDLAQAFAEQVAIDTHVSDATQPADTAQLEEATHAEGKGGSSA